jgi:hypothetical protein
VKQKNYLILLAVLLILTAYVWYSRLSGPQVIIGPADLTKTYPALGVDNPQLHWWKLNAARKTEYKSNGRNIFAASLPALAAPSATRPSAPVGPLPTPPPPPPTLPLKFFGYGTIPTGAPRRAFLSDGEQVIIVTEGETLLGRFRILKIGNANLEFEEIGTGQRGTAALEEQGPQA